jgi:release factor glutamine methyltransferase
MTLGQIYQWTCSTLKSNEIEDYKLESMILLGAALEFSAVDVYNHWNLQLSTEQEAAIQEFIRRRINREPSAYITRHKEFYGLDFYVDNRVLIPRPETELLIDTVIQDIANRSAQLHKGFSIVDVGTGSGAIVISLAVKFPDISFFAIDNSEDALEVAKINSKRFQVSERISFIHGNLLEPLQESADLILANLPYIESAAIETLAPEIRDFEPINALNGGNEGLTIIQKLLESAENKLKPDGSIFLEFGIDQKENLIQLIQNLFPGGKTVLHPDCNNNTYLISIQI